MSHCRCYSSILLPCRAMLELFPFHCCPSPATAVRLFRCCRGTAKLHEAQAALAATEETGIAVIDTLQQQREQILRTTDKAGDVNSLTDKARSIVIGIQRRAITNKFILCELRSLPRCLCAAS